MIKAENYMKAKYPEPTVLVECWRRELDMYGKPVMGTRWYRIADSHLSSTPLSSHPHYWICACDEHKPYTKLASSEKEPAMKDYSRELDAI